MQFAICLRKVRIALPRGRQTVDTERRKESIQKTIMAMTLGKDVSALFPDVLKNIATPDLDQKKLVYLYLMWALDWRLFGEPYIDHVAGIMQNHIQTSASLQ